MNTHFWQILKMKENPSCGVGASNVWKGHEDGLKILPQQQQATLIGKDPFFKEQAPLSWKYFIGLLVHIAAQSCRFSSST